MEVIYFCNFCTYKVILDAISSNIFTGSHCRGLSNRVLKTRHNVASVLTLLNTQLIL